MASTRPAPLWKYPIRAASDLVIMLLGLVLATWPLLVVLVLVKILL